MNDMEIAEIRRFNRYYTNLLGLLDQHILSSEYSLAEVRVLYEIEKNTNITMRMLSEILTMDEGYLSRILKKLQNDSLIDRTKSPSDGRAYLLSLTEKGKNQIQEMHRRSDQQIAGFLSPLSTEQKTKLVQHMQSIENILSGLPK